MLAPEREIFKSKLNNKQNVKQNLNRQVNLRVAHVRVVISVYSIEQLR